MIGLSPRKTRPHSNSQSKAHVPTLKGVGKSDCAVKIVHINDCEADVPLDLLIAGDDGSDRLSPNELSAVLAVARSPAPSPLADALGSMTLASSRSARVQKASRRPQLARRDTPPRTPRGSYFNSLASPNGYISSATIRRLTSGFWAVRKEAHTGGMQDGSRLLKQIRKQIIFSATCRNNSMHANITTPEIYGLRRDNKGIIVDMEYIPFHDCKHIMLTQDKATNEWLVETAIAIVDSELTKCEIQPIGSVLPAFESKAISIKSALKKKAGGLVSYEEMDIAVQQIDSIMAHYAARPNLAFPSGTCHGDLTFQNMLVDSVNHELCVFDFLDSFVESPLQDVAKLLQDCRHLWFLTQVKTTPEQRARIITMLNFFHGKIMDAYYNYEIWDALPLFEFFCLARILPYMTTEQEKICIMAGMSAICKDLECSFPAIFNAGPQSPSTPPPTADEKVTMIVPAMGADMARIYSGDGQPKLLYRDHTNVPLIVRSIRGIDVDKVTRIIFAVEEAVVLAACGSQLEFESLFDVLEPAKRNLISFHYCKDRTRDVVDTVLAVQSEFLVTGPLFIKEADNEFTFKVEVGNYLNLVDVVSHQPRPSGHAGENGKLQITDATCKSYLGFTYDNIVANLAYGSFVSSSYCCGGWGFHDASDFVRAANGVRASLKMADSLVAAAEDSAVKLQITDIVWRLICEESLFFGVEVRDYVDWVVPIARKSSIA